VIAIFLLLAYIKILFMKNKKVINLLLKTVN